MIPSRSPAARLAELTLLLCCTTAALGFNGEAAPEASRTWATGLPPEQGSVGPLSLREDAAQFSHTSRFLFRRLFSTSSRGRSFWTLGSILGASTILAHNKQDIQESLLSGTDEESNEWSVRAKKLGEPGVVPGLGLLLFLQGLAFRQPQVHDTGLMILESALYTGLFTEAGKFVLAEERPDQGGGMNYFQGSGHGVSGHAAIAASMAAPLSRGLFRVEANDGRWKRFGKRLGTGLAYGLPVLTGLSRIEDNRHYAWNVGLGLALGFAVGDTVADAHESRREENDSRWAPSSVGPLLTESGRGLALTWKF